MRQHIIFYLLLACLVILAFGNVGCKTTTKEEVTVIDTIKVTPIHSEKEYVAEWSNKEWTDILVSALDEYGKDMVLMEQPKDADKWCPQFENFTYERRKQVFVTMVVAMAKRESNWKPETNYTESFTDSKGKKVISRGLLQISQESANQSAYKCEISEATMLNHPGVNLACGVKIMNHWIGKKDKYFGTDKLGAARYWSVARNGSSKTYVQGKVRDMCLKLSKAL